MKLRMVWDLSDGADKLLWRNEMSVADEPWTLIEEYEMRPLSAQEL